MTTQLKFANLSNHPYDRWDESQLKAATEMVKGGELLMFPFPNVPATATTEQVQQMADGICRDILGMETTHAMVQGEPTLVKAITDRLIPAGVICVAACSERNSVDNGDGTKTVSFDFVQFRPY